jgi:hypothetical protein
VEAGTAVVNAETLRVYAKDTHHLRRTLPTEPP